MRYLSRHLPFWPRRLSLRTILVVPFVLQLAVAFGLVAAMSFRHGRAAVYATIDKLQAEIARNIEQEIDRYLADARRAIQFSADEIALDHLNLDDRDGLRAYLFQQLQRFEGLGYTAIATESGQYVGISRIGDDGSEILLDWFGDGGLFEKWQLDALGQPTELQQVRDDYDHRERPWYRAAVERGSATWSEVFQYHGSQRLVISANQPFYDESGQLVGVLSADLRLEQIDWFLASLEIGKTGGAFVLDERGRTIAASEIDTSSRHRTELPDATASSVPMVREVSMHLFEEYGNLPKVRTEHVLEIQGERVLAQTIPYAEQPGIEWTIVVVIPARDFMGPIVEMSRKTSRVYLIAIGLTIVSGIVTARWIAKPIRALAQDSRTLSSSFDRNDRSELGTVKPQSIHELHLLATAFARMAVRLRASFRDLEAVNQDLEARVHNRTRELQEANHALQRLASIDGLTQIANRRRFDEEFARCWRVLSELEVPLAVVLCDVDHFKLFNDTYGHQAGDDCLQRVAQAIDEAVEDETDMTDASEDYICSALTARYGGEEFAILLPGLLHARIVAVLDEVQARISEQAIVHCKSSAADVVSLSLGVATIVPHETLAPEALLQAADRALYEAKAKGRNRYCFAPPLLSAASPEASPAALPAPPARPPALPPAEPDLQPRKPSDQPAEKRTEALPQAGVSDAIVGGDR